MITIFNWMKKHIVLSAILFIVIFILIIPLTIQIFVSLPSIIPNTGNNDWIGYWGGFIGAFIGSLVTLTGIAISNIENRKQLQKSIRANRDQMLEEKRIDKSPFFYVEQFSPITKNEPIDGLVFIGGSNYEIINYSITEKHTDEFVVGLTIKNISVNYALRLKTAIIDNINNNTSPFLLKFNEKSVFSPDDHITFHIHIHYDKQQLIEKHGNENNIFGENYYVRICYDTVYDSISRRDLSPERLVKYWDRANKFDIFFILEIEYDDNDDLMKIKSRVIPLNIEMDGFTSNEKSYDAEIN